MMPPLASWHRGGPRRGQALILCSAVAWSTTGIFQRELSVNTITQVVGRALFGFVALVTYLLVTERDRALSAIRSMGRPGLASTGCTVLTSVSFIVALNHTSVAHVLIILAVAPIVASLLSRVVLGEPIGRLTWLAMLMSLVGVTVMVGTGGRSGILGDAIALVMTLGFAANVVILRRHHEMSMAPAAALSQLIVVVAGAPFSRLASVGSHDLVFLVLIGAGSLGLGVIFLMRGSRLIPVTDVMIISLLEVVLGPLGVWLVFSQWPGVATLVGGVIVLAAVGLQILGRVHSASVGLGVEP